MQASVRSLHKFGCRRVSKDEPTLRYDARPHGSPGNTKYCPVDAHQFLRRSLTPSLSLGLLGRDAPSKSIVFGARARNFL
jgi:hypothetical protein